MTFVGRVDLNIPVTGAEGFIGQALTSALLSDHRVFRISMTDVIKLTLSRQSPQSAVEIRSVKADLTFPGICESLFTPDLTFIYL